jgi:hypothetical protein
MFHVFKVKAVPAVLCATACYGFYKLYKIKSTQWKRMEAVKEQTLIEVEYETEEFLPAKFKENNGHLVHVEVNGTTEESEVTTTTEQTNEDGTVEETTETIVTEVKVEEKTYHHKHAKFTEYVFDKISLGVGRVQPRDQIALRATKQVIRRKVNELCEEHGVHPGDALKVFRDVWKKYLTYSTEDIEEALYEMYIVRDNQAQVHNSYTDNKFHSAPWYRNMVKWIDHFKFDAKPLPNKCC